MGLLRELVPTATMVALLLNPTNAAFQLQMKDTEDAARALGVQTHTLNAANEQEFTPLLTPLPNCGPERCLSAGTPSSIAGASNSPLWQPTTPFRQSTRLANTLWLAV